jgi:hypothetical protein
MIRRTKRWDTHAVITHGDSPLHVLLIDRSARQSASIELQVDRFDDRCPAGDIVFDEPPKLFDVPAAEQPTRRHAPFRIAIPIAGPRAGVGFFGRHTAAAVDRWPSHREAKSSSRTRPLGRRRIFKTVALGATPGEQALSQRIEGARKAAAGIAH